MFRNFVITSSIISSLLVLGACQAQTDKAQSDENAQQSAPHNSAQASSANPGNYPAAYPVKRQFECLPDEAAFIAAHRGTSKKEGLPENAAGGLRALIEHGTLFAEIDVAGLKDGTLILFHDGVWDDKSTGRGALAASKWRDVRDYLLLDTEGGFSADRPLLFKDALHMSKDLLYLEIDFKSSAKYEPVIAAIEAAGMSDQVILIAYSRAQAAKLSRLAPDMMISASLNGDGGQDVFKASGVAKSQLTAWLGKGPYDKSLLKLLAANGIPVLTWPGRGEMKITAGPASLMVNDYALKHPPIIGLSDAGRAQYMACLESK